MPDADSPPAVAPALELRATGYRHPDAALLVAGVQRVYVRRYGDADVTPVDPAEFAPPDGHFLVGYADGAPVACGGWRRRHAHPDEPELRDGDAEIKRMYVVDEMRGRGFARRLLGELERTAARRGALRMVLETGVRQPEALALYRSAGYREIPTYGVYRCSPNSRCFAKPLA